MGEGPIVIAGCGSIGRRHALNTRELTDAPLLLVDPDRSRAAALAQEVGGRPFQSIDEALAAGARTALICTPSQEHLDAAMRAAVAGCDLFIEKPLASRLEGTATLAEAVQSRSLIGMVACNMRFHPGPAEIRRALECAEIGDVLSARVHCGSFLPSWRPQQDYKASYSASPAHGGAVLDCIHEVDLALWYLGPATLRCAATRAAAAIGLETDGLAELLLVHESGALSSVHLNFVQRDYSRTCQMVGTSGTLEWSWRTGDVLMFDARGAVARRTPQPAAWDVNDMYLAELRHFFEACDSRRPAMNAIPEAAATLAIALAARQAGAV